MDYSPPPDADRAIWKDFIKLLKTQFECKINISSVRISDEGKAIIYHIETDTIRLATLVFKHDELEIQKIVRNKEMKYITEDVIEAISYGDPRFCVETIVEILKDLEKEIVT